MLRDIYAQKAISQIPRLLGNMDRNPYSPTYGCFHRDYWLDKTSDFPDAVRQFGVHALALVYKHDFPDNIYKDNKKILAWTLAAMDFWTKIQHKDGSFDEFYPYERGWVGPTAFTSYTIIESYQLLKDEISPELSERIRIAVKKAAYFIAEGEAEEDHLANHHAMACLALWKAYELLGEEKLKLAFEKAFEVFLTYHNSEEGWSREYDGIDPGYLSATVSFLGKVYQTNKDPRILKVLTESVQTCAYFAYPNGFYAGSLGSRNTLHFYPHGFEILAAETPLAAAVAEKMLKGLSEGKLVPPEVMSDRYVFYRVPEFLLAYLDYSSRPSDLPKLPHEKEEFYKYFDKAKIYVKNLGQYHVIANLAKGGVIKIFDRRTGELIQNDGGIIGKLKDGQIITSQWIDPGYQIEVNDQGWSVSGYLNFTPANKLFTPIKNIIFRSILILIGWSPYLSHVLKGKIRKMLILGQRKAPVKFSRCFTISGGGIKIEDELKLEGACQLESLSFGDEFFVRYVPQSRYFQSQELRVRGYKVDAKKIGEFNLNRCYIKSYIIKL